MPEKTIKDAHHVVRHCPRNRTIRTKEGVVVGVIPRLFELRAKINETYLSASYFEYFDGDDATRISKSISATPKQISDSDYMVLMNVGKTKEIAKRCKHAVKVMHETKHKTNPAYAKIKGVPFDPSSVALQLFANEAKTKMFLVRDYRTVTASDPAAQQPATATATASVADETNADIDKP